MPRPRKPWTERSAILRFLSKSPLNTTQRTRARARNNQLLFQQPEAHPTIVSMQKSVARAERKLKAANESQNSMEAARLRAQAMNESSASWIKGTRWIKRGAAWVRKKSIPVVHPIDAWKTSRVSARKKDLSEKRNAQEKQRTALQKSAQSERERIIKQVEQRLPSIRKRIVMEIDTTLAQLAKPPFSRQGVSQLRIARGYVSKVSDPETMIRFDQLLQELRQAVRKGNRPKAVEIATSLRNFE